MSFSTTTIRVLLTFAVAVFTATAAAAQSVRIENPIAVFSALDKVTARISKIEIKLNDTIRFGSLKVTPRVCYSRPATERPKTTSFVEIAEVQLDGKEDKLFAGWMFAESPGLNAVEHPVFDVWLSECKGGAKPNTARRARQPSSAGVIESVPSPQPRRRVRR